MTKLDPTSTSRRNQVGRHRARTFIDTIMRVHQRACKRGHHRFGKPQWIGAGIQRATCSVCGSVSIDLRDAAGVQRVSSLIKRAHTNARK